VTTLFKLLIKKLYSRVVASVIGVVPSKDDDHTPQPKIRHNQLTTSVHDIVQQQIHYACMSVNWSTEAVVIWRVHYLMFYL